MALADQVWMPFVISAVVPAFSGAGGSQLFAAVHDDLQTTANPVADVVVSIVRMALTAGWVVGPVLGSILATAAGSRVMLAATGSCALAQTVPMGFARSGSARPGAHTASVSEGHQPQGLAVFPGSVPAGFPSPSRQRGCLFPTFPPVAQIPACSVSNDSTGPADAHEVERALVQ